MRTLAGLILFALAACAQPVPPGGGGKPTLSCGGSGDTTHALQYVIATNTWYCGAITGSAAPGGSNLQIQWNNAAALGGISGWTTNGTTTVTGGASSILDLSAAATFKPPASAGAAPTALGVVSFDSTNLNIVFGNGTSTNHATYITGSAPSAGVAVFAGSTYAITSTTTPTLTGTNFSGIGNAALTNSAITIAGTSVSLGGSTSSLPSPGAIGGTTPAAGTFTALTANTSFVLNGSGTLTSVQGTDTALLSAGTISGTAATLCTDSNGGATTSGCSAGGSSAFSSLTSGTNTAAAMLVGTGASLGVTGTGSISATTISGGATNDLVYQAGSGTTGFLAPVSSAVLSTNGSGVPAESTTLPTGLAMQTPASITLTNGAGLPITGIANGTSTGEVVYWNGSAWTALAGNSSGTNYLQETSSGVPSWAAGSSSVSWSGITNPSGNLSLTMGADTSTFNTTTAVSNFFEWANTTAATSTVAQSSPILTLAGTAWHGSASTSDAMTLQYVPNGSGNDQGGTITIGHSGGDSGLITTSTPGPVQTTSDGVHAGGLTAPGNTTLYSTAANSFSWWAPNSATCTWATSVGCGVQWSATAPTAGNMLLIGAPSGTTGIAQVTYGLVPTSISGATSGAIPTATSATTIGTVDPTNFQYVASTAAPSAPTVATHGTAGSTTHGYCAALRPVNANGPNSACSATATITTSNATVNGTNYDIVTAPTCTSSPSGTTVDLYLVTAGGNLTTLGWENNVACGAALNVQGNGANAGFLAPSSDLTKALYTTGLAPGTLIQMGPQTASVGNVLGFGLKPVDPRQSIFGLYSACSNTGGWINDCGNTLAFNGANENPLLPNILIAGCETVYSTSSSNGQSECYNQFELPASLGAQTGYRPSSVQVAYTVAGGAITGLTNITNSYSADNYQWNNRTGTPLAGLAGSGFALSVNGQMNGNTLYMNQSNMQLNTDGSGNFSIGNGSNVLSILASGRTVQAGSLGIFGFSSTTGSNGTLDTGISRDSAGVLDVGNGTQGDRSGTVKAGAYSTGVNCSSSASPAVCTSAAAGSVAIPTGVTSVALTVNTSAVTANSQIILFADDTLGTKLSVTCNSTLATLVGGMAVTARTAGTSFTVTYNGTIATNPLCVSYLIVN